MIRQSISDSGRTDRTVVFTEVPAMNLFDLPGPQFLALYSGMLIGAASGGFLLRWLFPHTRRFAARDDAGPRSVRDRLPLRRPRRRR